MSAPVLAFLAASAVLPARAGAQTELGSEDDLTVLGVNGTEADPDTEIKGFTVFGATQSAYTGAQAGAGNVVVNGALAVSSGAYFVGDSTFQAAGKIFINDGAAGQILSKNSAGSLQWTSSSAMGDNLGDHVATTTLNMASFGIIGVSTISASGIYISSYGVIQTTGTGLGGVLGNSRGYAAVDLQSYRAAAAEVAGGIYSVVGGGRSNTASAMYSIAGGGQQNVASGNYSVVSGGDYNVASAERAAVGGGKHNTVESGESVVAGGAFNTASGGGDDFVGGGAWNMVSGGNSTIGGGYLNTVTGAYSTIGGGEENIVSGVDAVVAGGWENIASGWAATVPGGNGNVAAGDQSFAAGTASSSAANGSFTWSDSQSVLTQNSVLDRTVFKNRGGFLITGSTNPVMGGALNRGLLVTGGGLVGISTGVPYAALDVVSSATASNVYAQIWRDSSGVEVASMTSTGVLYATLPPGAGDNLGNHTATQDLDLAQHGAVSVASITMVGKGLQIGTDLTSSANGVFISTSGQIMTVGLGNGTALPNARGQGAVDLQTYRTNSSSVAAGAYDVIAGGRNNRTFGPYAVVAGGSNNTASGESNVVAGGDSNVASGAWASTVGGGIENVADHPQATVSGGWQNFAQDYNATVAGGTGNYATMEAASVGGGDSNYANAYYATIPGGGWNVVTGDYGVAVGVENTAMGSESAALGGAYNIASGYAAIALGGEYNVAGGEYSFAAGYLSSSTANGAFTWSDSQGVKNINGMVDRTVFKNRGGFLITGSTNPVMGGALNRGLLVTGGGLVGISTGVPYAALDVVSSATASNVYAQIWRDSSGVEVASMTSTGVLYATLPPGSGDNLGNHVATKELDMAGNQILGVSTLTVTGNAFSVGGSTLAVSAGKVGIGTDSPGYKLEVKDTGMAGFQVDPQTGYVSLRVNGVEVAQMIP